MVSQVAKRIALSIAEYAACYIIFTIMTVPMHEWVHLVVARMLGGDGYIVATPFGALTVLTKIPEHFYLVAFSGGIFTAIVYLILFIWDVHDNDVEEYCSIIPLITSQLGYGVFEGMFVASMPMDAFISWGTVVLIVCWGIGMLASLCTLIYHLRQIVLKNAENTGR